MVDLVSDLADRLLKHVILLSQVIITLLLVRILLLDRCVSLLVSGELSRGMLKLRLVRHHLIIALLELPMNLVAAILNALNLRLLALNVRLDLCHFVHQLVERRLDLLPVPPKLLRLLPHLQIHPLEDLLFLGFRSLLLRQSGLYLRVLRVNLVALLGNLQLLLAVIFDLSLGLGDLRDLHLLLIVDHDVLALQQLKVLLELLLTLLTLINLRMQVVNFGD